MRRYGMEEEMKKIIVLPLITCMFLSGCGFGISMSGEDADMESAAGIFDVHTSYYERYSIDQDEDVCEVKGTLRQAADDYNSVITYLTAEEGGGGVSVTGFIECRRGNLQLVYTAPDGTETLIAEDTDKKIDMQVDVTEGEGSIHFAGNGESAICDFRIKMKADASVRFTGIMEPEAAGMEEDPESQECIEDLDSAEMGVEDTLADIEDIGVDEIENNWPESIRYHSNGCSANPMSTGFEIDGPVTLSVSCATRSGKLRLKIVRHSILGEVGETVYFDERNPDGEYTVDLDKKGRYNLLFYAGEHVGSVEIIPEEP